ncbi:MAG: toll/interleukin-1 receptor domain-containing protein [Caldilineaceae bacterium]|nr:toll/interleukin-1 receptor domain-containing protein [Caldilineaceae bacterium]HRJ40508.1 toll/interleukin-1 receptor domain-containing protein [Caldilineaceae bacterium]
MAEPATYRYDLFISYSPADEGWVWTWLMPKLVDAGLEVCAGRECFEPGVPVVQETERAIRESRRFLAVLTPAWVEGEWNSFEALLLQHRDPAARGRRLIPILLQPCQPPERIQLLHWLDFTDPEQRDAQLERLVQTLRGISTLPELRPEDAFPDARRRWWELRWYALAAIFAFLTLVVVVIWIVFQPDPLIPGFGAAVNVTVEPTPFVPMPAGKFNIAVAEFHALDANNYPIESRYAFTQAQRIANFLVSQAVQLEPVIRTSVEVWGPDRDIEPVADGSEEDRASALGASVLIYGNLHQLSAQQWSLEPKFYLSQAYLDDLTRADELRGEFALGRKVPFQPGNLASEGDLNQTVADRLDALVGILRGLSYYAPGPTNDYGQAARTFQKLVDSSPWATAAATGDRSGQEVLYLFLGNAYLMHSWSERETPEVHRDLLIRSQDAYTKALELSDQEYVRAYNGLGQVFFQLSGAPTSGCDGLDRSALQQSAEAQQKALLAPESAKPLSGDVDMRAHLGLAQVHYWLGRCSADDIKVEWAAARQEYEAVLTDYLSAPERAFDARQYMAVHAYTGLGHVALFQTPQNEPQTEAIKNYSQAVALAVGLNTAIATEHAINVMPYLLTAYCREKQSAAAIKALDDLVQPLLNPEATRATILRRVKNWETCNEEP